MWRTRVVHGESQTSTQYLAVNLKTPQNVVVRRESPVLNAEAPGAEKKLLCLVPGKTATPRRLVSRIRLWHAMAAGFFRPPHPNIQSHA